MSIVCETEVDTCLHTTLVCSTRHCLLLRREHCCPKDKYGLVINTEVYNAETAEAHNP